VEVAETDGSQPVGRGIGPTLEARDVLAVLRQEPDAPGDLRDRALSLAARLLEMGGAVRQGNGLEKARAVLTSGGAWRKFLAICEAQGGFREPSRARYTLPIPAPRSGRVVEIDNRRLSRIAKLAGAPAASTAGVDFHAPIGALLQTGEPMFTLHAESPGQLEYARAYVEAGPPAVLLGAPDAAAVAAPAGK
jgi:thymidine phosphorylase